jgi:hypothetical protein
MSMALRNSSYAYRRLRRIIITPNVIKTVDATELTNCSTLETVTV